MIILENNDDGFLTRVKESLYNEFAGVIYSPLNIDYAKCRFSASAFSDISFMVVDEQTPVVTVIMTLETKPDGKKIINAYGRPVAYIENEHCDNRKLIYAAGMIKKKLADILARHDPDEIRHHEYLQMGRLSFLGQYLLDAGATAAPYFTQVLDLSADEAELKKDVRKSYKSLINWGKNNIHLTLLGSDGITEENMEDFRQLHIKVSGRETRPPSTWKKQYESVLNNEAFVITGHLEGELVTASFFRHNAVRCIYAVSASLRELFDKPISHVIIWQAILYSKKLGCRHFETGEQLYPNQGRFTKKEFDISKFKRGFGGNTRLRLNITWKKP